MTYTDYTKPILNIKDNNIYFNKNFVKSQNSKKNYVYILNYFVIIIIERRYVK